MIASTLVANGAKVYIVGPEQKELERYGLLQSPPR